MLAASNMPLEDRIRDRAHFLSQGGGGVYRGGYFWQIAEREVLTEVAMESAAMIQFWDVARAGRSH